MNELLELIDKCNKGGLVVEETPLYDIAGDCDVDNDAIIKVYCQLVIDGYEHREYGLCAQNESAIVGMHNASRQMMTYINELVHNLAYL